MLLHISVLIHLDHAHHVDPLYRRKRKVCFHYGLAAFHGMFRKFQILALLSRRYFYLSPHYFFRIETVLKRFAEYGEIVNHYRPMDFTKRRPSPFAFIRFRNEEDARAAIMEMDGATFGDNAVVVTDGNSQDSYFTQDTGFITNEAFDKPRVVVDNFDSSLPSNHYEIKRKLELSKADRVYSIRIDDLPLDVT
jgi:hypothetical protein